MKKIFPLLFVCLLVFCAGCKTKVLTPKQLAEKAENIEKIEGQKFVFTPMSAQPMRGRNINLSPMYSLSVSKDTIYSYLPFFGRSQIAPTDPTNIGIKFISTKFGYEVKKKSNGVYEIKITPQDLPKREDRNIILYLNISDSGYGSLDVQSMDRDNVSFYGTFE